MSQSTVSRWKPPRKPGEAGYVVPLYENVLATADFFEQDPTALFRMLGEAGQDYLRRWEKASLPTGQSASRRWKRARHEEAHQKLQQILDDAGSEATVILAVLDALMAIRRADEADKQERSLAN